MPSPLALFLASGVLFSAPAAFAQHITVNAALEDVMDFGGAQTVADLPGPDGLVTLREAVTAANNTPGPQTIDFAIPTSEWSIFYTDRAIIRIENMIYLSADDTTIDFSTQTLFTGDTNPDGNEVGIQYAGVPSSIPALWLAANRCTIKGLDVGFGNNFSNTIWITGNHNRVIGCTTNGLMIRGDYGGGANNTIGGTAPGEGNTFSEGVDILSKANNNVVVGNIFRWGFRISGDTFWGTCDNNRIGGPTDAERNNFAGKGLYGEEGLPTGTQLEIQHAVGTIVENNFVGTTPDGSAKLPGRSGSGGIFVYTGAVNTVVRNNLISGIAMAGINHYQGQRFGTALGVGSTATGTVITGNRIGIAADGTSPIPNVQGILIYSDPNGIPSSTRIGGPAPADANLVTANETVGVRVMNSAAGVRITANSIFDNGELGIDLLGFAPAGVTPNDPGDPDTGGNSLQNFPVLSSAERSGSGTAVRGTLNSLPNQAFTLEFFANASCDPSGYGEGQMFLGSTGVTTDASGNVSFIATLGASAPAGSAVTSTATQNSTGNTSEFSECTPLSGGGCAADFNHDGQADFFDYLDFVQAFAAEDAAADIDGNGQVDFFDYLEFVAAFDAGC
jgi:hypothetical protein